MATQNDTFCQLVQKMVDDFEFRTLSDVRLASLTASASEVHTENECFIKLLSQIDILF